MRFEFLGTSDTGGIPLHGCGCVVCQKARKDGKTNRSTCAFLELEDKSVILFDAGYDGLVDKFNQTHIRAVFLTHFHADHALGLIRLRKSVDNIPCYIPNDKEGFGDLFKHKCAINYIVMNAFDEVEIENIKISAVPLMHSKPTNGYVVSTKDSSVAYLTDCENMSNESMDFLKSKKLEHLFLDACYTPDYHSKKHLNWKSAAEYIDEISPKNGHLIHASCHTLLPIVEDKIILKYPYIDKGFCVEI